MAVKFAPYKYYVRVTRAREGPEEQPTNRRSPKAVSPNQERGGVNRTFSFYQLKFEKAKKEPFTRLAKPLIGKRKLTWKDREILFESFLQIALYRQWYE